MFARLTAALLAASLAEKWCDMAGAKQVWDKPRPKSLGKPKALTPAKKAKAKAAAKAAGRPYPNLVDNMRAAK